MNDAVPQSIAQVYAQYAAEVAALELRRKPTDGIWGFGASPSGDPCHQKFAAALQTEIAALKALPVDPQTAEAVIRAICEQASLQELRYVRTMLEVVQGYAAPLAPLLLPQQAAGLFTWYNQNYPRNKRLPLQDKLAAALQQRAKQ